MSASSFAAVSAAVRRLLLVLIAFAIALPASAHVPRSSALDVIDAPRTDAARLAFEPIPLYDGPTSFSVFLTEKGTSGPCCAEGGGSAQQNLMHARFYNSTSARFLSVDPGGGESIRLQMPQTWNRYTYALNNPIRYVDPTGRVVECVPNPKEGEPPICSEVIDVEGETPPVEPQPPKPRPAPRPIPIIRRAYPTPLPADFQITAALGVMWGNYQEMRDRNFRGADRYYHCMAHCEATLQGPAGIATSHVVGFGREAIDFWANIYNPRKQMDPGSSWKDCSGDMAANAQGRARSGQATCREQCKSLAPAGLNP